MLLLGIGYLAVDYDFDSSIAMYENVPVNYTAGNLVNITSASTDVRVYTNTINYQLQATTRNYNTFDEPFADNKVCLFMTTIFFAGSLDNSPPFRPINYYVGTNIISDTNYTITVTLST